MPRTLQQGRMLAAEIVLEYSRPMSTFELHRAVKPQSLEVHINGRRVARSDVDYDTEAGTVTVPWLLFEGDTFTATGVAAGT